MVVDEFDVVGVAITPNETNAPLLIYPDAVLTVPVTVEAFQPIARQLCQILYGICRMQHQQFSKCPTL